MDTPGLHHIILTVSDIERSIEFYGGLLGFDLTTYGEAPNQSFYFTCGEVMFFFQKSPQPLPGDRFSEFRIGLDHLSFIAPSRAALEQMADKLLAAGVDTKGVEKFAPTGNDYMAFRDPDNIQLEYWLPD